NVDRVASSGLRFENAYCQVPTCGASRASLMTSLYPTQTRFPDFKCFAEQDARRQPTLPQRFKEAGYITLSNGKVFHHRSDTESRSWSEPAWRPEITGRTSYNPDTSAFLETSPHTKKRPGGKVTKKPVMFEKGKIDPLQTNDGLIAQKTMNDLKRLAKGDRPFFIACGFAKPHMPFYSPAQTWKPYPLDSVALAGHRARPEGMPQAARVVLEQNAYIPMTHKLDQLLSYNSNLYHRYMRQGYYASVTHADDLLGRILDQMERLGLQENTYLVILGDHGWLLGEHNEWAKNTLLHEALRTALWIQGPGVAQNAAVDTFVEFVDLHPTLCALAGITFDPHLMHGQDFRHLLTEPKSDHRPHAYTRFEQGDALTTDDFFFALWETEEHGTERLLIDRQSDPHGQRNVAENAAYQEVVRELEAEVRKRIQVAGEF
ncbi:MAG: sulfatase-like hydrolase/transferase, partial [Verrucomicrobiota bacterium]